MIRGVSLKEALVRVDGPDLSAVKQRMVASGWPRHVANEVEIEYRRFLLLSLMHPDDRLSPPPLIEEFWRRHTEEGASYEDACSLIFGSYQERRSPSQTNGTSGSDLARMLYERTFPGWQMTYWNARCLGDVNRHTEAVMEHGNDREPARASSHAGSDESGTSKSTVKFVDSDLELEPLAERIKRDGFVHLKKLLTMEATLTLASEARDRRSSAGESVARSYQLGDSGRVGSPRAHLSSFPGICLRSLHEDPALLAAVRALTGRLLLPTRASYIYYRLGDFIGLHTDVSPCTLTLIIGVLGETEPLILHPELLALAPEQLYEKACRSHGLPTGGMPVPIPAEGALALLGSKLPHHRPPTRKESAIATLCYAAIG